MRALGREVAIAFDYFLQGLEGFGDFWDERRWAMWRDRHQRLGSLLAMVVTVLLWYALGAWLPPTLRSYGTGGMFLASCVGLFVWFGVAAFSRSRVKG